MGGRRRRLLIVALAAVVSVPGHGQDPAFSFAEVDFTPDCRPNAAFERLLTVLHGRVLADDETVAADLPLYDAVSGDTFHRLILDDPADWHGLHLAGIDLVLGIERGPANFTLVFADSPARVREVWNARGWHLPLAGQDRPIGNLEGYASIGIGDVDGGGASVTCFRD